jgi:hypothetical protein
MSGHSADLAVVRGFVALGVLLVAGCGAPSAPETAAGASRATEPRTAILYRDTVTVQFSDGALCVAPRPSGARAWSGQLAGCPHLLPYEVTLPPGAQAPRRVLVGLADGGTAVLSLPQTRFGLPGPS